MELITGTSKQQGKYGTVKRSVLRNLLVSMLTFGLFVGLIFPPFAKFVLDTDKAYSPIFIFLCVLAGLLVGIFNFFIFHHLVSRELVNLTINLEYKMYNKKEGVSLKQAVERLFVLIGW